MSDFTDVDDVFADFANQAMKKRKISSSPRLSLVQRRSPKAKSPRRKPTQTRAAYQKSVSPLMKKGGSVYNKLRAGRIAQQQRHVQALQALSGNLINLKNSNAAARAIHHDRKARHAVEKQLFGGSPLKGLLAHQRGSLSQKRVNKQSVDPILAVQYYAQAIGDINTAAKCAAAVELGRKVSHKIRKEQASPKQRAAWKAAGARLQNLRGFAALPGAF